MTQPALSDFDLRVLDAADCRPITGIAYVLGSHRQNADVQRVSCSLSKMRRAGLVQIVAGTYPVEFQWTDAGLRALEEPR